MRALASLILVTLATAGPAWASGFDHTPLDRVLKTYVNVIGEVDYAALKKNSADLGRYVETLAATSPANRPHLFPTREDRLAYWLNAYNALVLHAVAARYPVKSVRNMGFLYSFFWLRKFVAGGQRMTLRHLENQMIRKQFGEPRTHFVLVCASLSCPFLLRQALVGHALEQQLEVAARRFVNQRRNFTIDAASNRVYLSGLYDLSDYEEEFRRYARKQNPRRKVTLLDYLRPYLKPGNLRALNALKKPKIKFFRYDWSINDLGSRARAKLPQERELARQ